MELWGMPDVIFFHLDVSIDTMTNPRPFRTNLVLYPKKSHPDFQCVKY